MTSDVPAVTPTALPTGGFLLDVREADEWDAGHAVDAVHIPMGQVPARLAEVPEDRPVVVVCRSGGRSAQVTAFLRQHGRDARNLDGGMHAWDDAGLPMTTASGAPAQVV